ncbi:MAG TPA: hypothetical protein PLH94_06945 [Fimbriimonadaceae bacterium]|nr:hypothetical protein [Fimbriimonadaceae bacterium]
MTKKIDRTIQVKGGNAMNLSTIRDFANVIESNKAVLGIMIGMKEPTPEMKRVADQMGYADWPTERKYPRYQILSIEGLLEKGVKPEIPDSYRLGAQTGVGRAQDDGQAGLFEGDD